MTVNDGLKTSKRAIDCIKGFEIDGKIGRVNLEAFDDGYGNWTIGWGRVNHFAGRKVQPGERITLEIAELYLQEDIGIAERAVKRCVTQSITQGQFDALVIFAFNAGGGGLRKATFLKLLNRGQFDEVPAAWMRFCYATDQKTGKKLKSNGLVRRRRAELGFWREEHEPDREDAIAFMSASMTDRKPGAVREAFQKSWTIFGALTALGGMILQAFDRAISFGLEAIAEVSRLDPIKRAALDFGGNLKSIGFAAALAGIVIVIGRRLDAARKGKEG